jgi:hypothetical protein
MEWLVGKKALNAIVSHQPEAEDGAHDMAKKVGAHAEAHLEAVRGSTHWYKIHPETSPPHETEIKVEKGTDPKHTQDSFVVMEGNNPMATEYGHHPSGVFGPEGSLGHVPTRPPAGLHILGLAAAVVGG